MITDSTVPQKVEETTGIGEGSMNLPVQIVTMKFDEHNYVEWSRSVMLFVTRCGKNNYLIDKTKAPVEGDSKYEVGSGVHFGDVMIIDLDVSEPEEDVHYLDTTFEIWSKLENIC